MTSPPLFGLWLNAASADLVAWATAAEEHGYDLVAVMDDPYDVDLFEAYTALTVALARTTRVLGYVGVTNLPLRPAPVLARIVSTLSALCDGRVVLGLGAGGDLDRAAAFGGPILTPGQAVDALEEAIRLVHALTGGGIEPVRFTGRHYRVDGALPAAQPPPPVWTGAGGPRALRITGRLADGWIPQYGDDWRSAAVREARAVIDDAALRAGRDPAEVGTCYNISATLTSRDLARTRDEDGRWIGGSARQWVDELVTAVTDYDAGGFTTTITDRSGQATLDLATRFAQDVIGPVRDATR
ncbi:LLM class flavin-dependent oxidoreductase [Leekyejoonella antrihumi]|uniref:LLM class flavin-dependent oxidoreductase n=1 Tax=Leekyejoonella antrihumi TaxID=1660198 RepID=A0A563E671_9MICO|nr:LLM class flavin-dependent oxidoreductase [Leekyejoonella antrihumi]